MSDGYEQLLSQLADAGYAEQNRQVLEGFDRVTPAYRDVDAGMSRRRSREGTGTCRRSSGRFGRERDSTSGALRRSRCSFVLRRRLRGGTGSALGGAFRREVLDGNDLYVPWMKLCADLEGRTGGYIDSVSLRIAR